MKSKAQSPSNHANSKNNKYEDWICHFCQNHNYSFRQICNRCHLQTKENNLYMTLLYQQQLQNQLEQESSIFIAQCQTIESQELFPYVVLLMINDDPWQQQPQIKEVHKPLNVKWINNLIQE